MVAFCLLLFACRPSTSPNVHGDLTKGHAELIFTRASFDFSCPREQIVLTRMGEQVGAEGCGHRGVYVPTDGGWALNSVGNAAEPSTEQPSQDP